MIPLNYHHLYYFHAIAQEGGVAKAARALFLAQPTLSAQLKEFEAALGRRLFDRVGRRLVLTEDGKAVLRYAEQIVRLGRELSDDLRDRPPGGALSVQLGATPGTPRAVVEALIAAALAAGASHVDCKEAPLPELLEDLGDHRIDALLSDSCDATHGAASRRWRRIARLPVAFAGTTAVVKRLARLPKGLAAVPLILPKAPSSVHRQVQTYLAENALRVRVVAEVPDGGIALRLARAGRGVAPLDSVTLKDWTGLAALAGGPSSLRHELWLAAAEGRLRPNPAAERLFQAFSVS
ncbi:MAG: LysR family transcriptional regulator, transcriptional activator of nhaA [Elusimicrobia bacterium]|nr:MAG: LysR family transcriptional regulator, transcriptional activator of nhaA [Elusimicrobiota bacterium]